MKMNEEKQKKKNNILTIFLLHVVFALFSLFGTASKLAAKETFFSLKFMMYYGIVIVNLGLYAIAWQQFLKKLQLTIAYANKAITIAWTILWGVILFDESIGFFQILGMIIIITGVIFVVTSGDVKND